MEQNDAQKELDQIRFDLDADLKRRFKLAIAKVSAENKNNDINQTSYLIAAIKDFCAKMGV